MADPNTSLKRKDVFFIKLLAWDPKELNLVSDLPKFPM